MFVVLALTASQAFAISSVYVDVVGGDAVLASGGPGSALKVTATQLVGSVDIELKASVTQPGIINHGTSLVNIAGAGNAFVTNFQVNPLPIPGAQIVGPSVTNLGAQLASNFGSATLLGSSGPDIPLASFTLNFDLTAGTPMVVGQAAGIGWANANIQAELVRYGSGLLGNGLVNGAGRGLLFTVEIPEPSTALLMVLALPLALRRRARRQ